MAAPALPLPPGRISRALQRLFFGLVIQAVDFDLPFVGGGLLVWYVGWAVICSGLLELRGVRRRAVGVLTGALGVLGLVPWVASPGLADAGAVAVIAGLLALCVAAEWALLELVERMARAGPLPHLAARTARTRRWYVGVAGTATVLYPLGSWSPWAIVGFYLALFGWWCAELAVLFRLWDAMRSFDRIAHRRRPLRR